MHNGQNLFDLLRIADLRQPPIQYEFANDIVDWFDILAIVRHGFQQIQMTLDVFRYIVHIDNIAEERFPYQRQLLELIFDESLIETVCNVPALD